MSKKEMNVNIDEFKFVYMFNEDIKQVYSEEGLVSVICEEFLSQLEDTLELQTHFSDNMRKSNGYQGYTRVIDYSTGDSLGLRLAYNHKRLDMGVLIEWKAKGLDNYCSSISSIDSDGKEIQLQKWQLFQFIVNDSWAGHNGYYKVRRFDIAVDFLNYKRETVGSFYNKLTHNELVIKKRSRKTGKMKLARMKLQAIAKDVYSGGRYNKDIETLYCGDRSSECFVRFYNKKKQLEDTGRSYELAKGIESYLRIEQELKYDKVASQDFIKQFNEIKSDSDFVSWCYDTFLDNFSLYNSEDNLYKLFIEMRKIADKKSFGIIRHNVQKRYSYERSKSWFESVDSGNPKTLFKISQIEGEDALNKYLDGIKSRFEEFKKDSDLMAEIKRDKAIRDNGLESVIELEEIKSGEVDSRALIAKALENLK